MEKQEIDNDIPVTAGRVSDQEPQYEPPVPQPDAVSSSVGFFRHLIIAHEDWLVTRVLDYAKQYGYTRYSSTLLEAWRLSVAKLSAVLLHSFEDGAYRSGLHADGDHAADPVTLYGIEEARKHRSRGVSLSLFISLLKYYRRAYLDLIVEQCGNPDDLRRYHDFILEVFDKIEIGCSDEWVNVKVDDEISALQIQNKELVEEKLVYLTIFESLKDPVIFADAQGHIRNMNRSACLCFTPYDTPGAIYYGRKEIDEIERLLAPFLDYRDTRDDFPDCLLPTRNGPRRFHIKTRRMIDSSERMAGIVLICSDITDFQQALHDAALADQAKSAFLATMSHELRTPAASIIGAAELLAHTGVTRSQSLYLDLIDASASTLLGILNEVLDYSKFNETGVTVETVDLDLVETIDGVVKIMRYQALRKGVTLSVTMSSRVPRLLRGDPDKLRRVLMNLLGNAVKFTEQGRIELTVRRIKKADAPVMLKFAIADTGIGIPSDVVSDLFLPFSQGDGSISRKFGGTGLGLAICKRIVDALGGEIGAKNREGDGSLFWFTLPFGPPVTRQKRVKKQAIPVSRPLSILLVEDNEVNQIVGIGLLEHLGHNVGLAGDGEEALAMLAEGDYNAVLLDIHLPGMDGYEVARRIRSLSDPIKSNTLIVALTADGGAAGKRMGDAINAFLTKPLRVDELNRILATAHDSTSNPLKLLDGSVLRDHAVALGTEVTERIVVAFRVSAKQSMAELGRAMRAGDVGLIAFLSHRLKGAAGNVGLVCLARLSGDVEARAAQMEPDELSAAVKQLTSCTLLSLRDLEAWWNEFLTDTLAYLTDSVKT